MTSRSEANLHTPGPWETGEASWNAEGEVRYTLHGNRFANAADARLIAAAPDLLAALKAGLPAMERLATEEMRRNKAARRIDPKAGTTHYVDAWNAARDAIAKATGAS